MYIRISTKKRNLLIATGDEIGDEEPVADEPGAYVPMVGGQFQVAPIEEEPSGFEPDQEPSDLRFGFDVRR